MTIGIKSASPLPQHEQPILKRILIFLLVWFVSAQEIDTLDFKMPKFSFTPKVFHHPARVLFNSRAFELEVFTKYPRDKIKSVSLFYKTDTISRLREVPFNPQDKRYVFRYDPKENPAGRIVYFFTVYLKDGGMFATPVDSSGQIMPVTKHLLNPAEYFKKRASLRN
ncbi:MAG: hypothetical protein HOA15_07670 [Candidatus Marinimicrobia bacterium]|jgi:hypothetical protein|nr:hypothetical protein [Candidatus Neomarinimicrobiota bacterium]MBT3676432.1 hypothetical protein [Candidatus Neomarinimicrobiota bacterium]MBT3764105.1 hypothetical protein [Candidatus Neomarinimicrobiota bacterium]MBT4067358.1 hypothetical protein [Candidatus Neomarinimicrobiota bacterium]MBT4271645.1 hypothetical protein [Candidatus Neomarinimicrobiota bacterium]